MSEAWTQMGARLREAAGDPADDRQEQTWRLAAEVRQLIATLVRKDASASAIADAAAHVEAARAALGGSTSGTPDRAARDHSFADFFDISPMVGRANPVAPPLRVLTRDRDVVGAVRFGAAYEGPPGHVHGGFIAATFDEVLGMAQSFSGTHGMTGTLTIRFRRPTPLDVDLVVEGRVERVEGRKIFTTAELLNDGEVTAEAEAVFIAVDFGALDRRAGEV